MLLSRLLTLTDWLTFWSLSDDISNLQLNIVQLNVLASWWFFHCDYLCTIFILSRLTSYVFTGVGTGGSRVSGCSPNFCGAGAVLPHKFGDVTDWRWWLFTCRLLQLHWCCGSFIIAYLQPAIHDTNLLEHTFSAQNADAVSWLTSYG